MDLEEPALKEIARLCTLDVGKEVLPGDVLGFLLFQMDYPGFNRFNTEEVGDIVATIIKEGGKYA